MNRIRLIRLVLEDERDATTEISIPGPGDLAHVAVVFEVVFGALGLEVESPAENEAVH
ncbi:hypothetical protein DFR24_3290 [Panacagrimonas perspica]|uniref:Uncharacterized protein n=1 Tax=Panacagrimonas perspica TaxID=381431 RepID=A0A4R7P749_9GAMM|nr:hypothetical protein [Panacagrimonas perspica]TDU28910.1 hypothetical protein DFR24_3290 [Panacagrimonas perspica]